MRVPPRTGSVIETVFREQGAYVGDHDIRRLMISAGLFAIGSVTGWLWGRNTKEKIK